MPTQYQPDDYIRISDPRQIKAFADPRRMRIMRILSTNEVTNQQLADALEEPPARILHHLRTLIDAGLVRRVDERIRGGNVEKYYRATARVYGFDLESDSGPSLASSALSSTISEVAASIQLWPDDVPDFEGRRARISPEQLQAFTERLNHLIDEYWGGPENTTDDELTADLYAFMSVVYRFPGKPE